MVSVYQSIDYSRLLLMYCYRSKMGDNLFIVALYLNVKMKMSHLLPPIH